jgi:hypothetical protein
VAVAAVTSAADIPGGREPPAAAAGVPAGTAAGQPVRDTAWLLSLLPVFPLVLLVLRLWALSRQDLAIMLLLVQNASPLGPISVLLITLIWVFPVGVLVAVALGALLRASRADAMQSRLGRVSARIPDWVIVMAVLVAALTWQLRFLPALLMLTLMILGLEVRIRHGGRVWLALGVLFPLCLAAAEYTWFGPAIGSAVRSGEGTTAILLLVPPAATLALTGPIPWQAARTVTSGTAMIAGLLAPFLIAAVFLHTAVLPTSALELQPDPPGSGPTQVLRGFVVGVDDTMTTLLDENGAVHFLPNQQVLSKTLCPDPGRPPVSLVAVHDWPVEETALQWIAPHRRTTAADPRCQGRPLHLR